MKSSEKHFFRSIFIHKNLFFVLLIFLTYNYINNIKILKIILKLNNKIDCYLYKRYVSICS